MLFFSIPATAQEWIRGIGQPSNRLWTLRRVIGSPLRRGAGGANVVVAVCLGLALGAGQEPCWKGRAAVVVLDGQRVVVHCLRLLLMLRLLLLLALTLARQWSKKVAGAAAI